MKTFNVTLYSTYTVNVDETKYDDSYDVYDEAINKAKKRAEIYDFDCGYSDVEEIEYDPEFD